MTIGWLLILLLADGTIDRMIRVGGPMECVSRSDFEMRLDPRIKKTICVIGTETET